MRKQASAKTTPSNTSRKAKNHFFQESEQNPKCSIIWAQIQWLVRNGSNYDDRIIIRQDKRSSCQVMNTYHPLHDAPLKEAKSKQADREPQ